MANSITGWNTFVPVTTIRSAEVNDNEEALRDMSPLWQKYTLTYASFAALGAVATGTLTAFQLASNEVITGVIVKHSTLFSGGAISAAKLKVGIAGEVDRYVSEFDVKQAVAAGASSQNQMVDCPFASTNILVVMSLTGGNLNALAQGSVDIYVQRSELP